MKQAISLLVFCALPIFAAVFAVSAAVGICASIWRYEAIASLIGPNSDRHHPASWVFLGSGILCGLFAIAGYLAIYLPLIHLVPWLDLSAYSHPSSRRLRSRLLRWERRCMVAWGRRIRTDLRNLDGAEKPEQVDPDL